MGQKAEGQIDRHQEYRENGTIECVFLTCFRSDFSFLATVLHYSRIKVHYAGTLEEADFLFTVTGSTVLLSDVAFLDGFWSNALQMLNGVHPLVGALLVADPVEHSFVADCYSLGACGVLWKPLDLSEAIRRIRAVHEAVCERSACFTKRLAPCGKDAG